jgi:hypothetical protein
MMSLSVSFDVEHRVAVPKFDFAVGAERNRRRLAVPDQQTSGHVVELRPAVLAVSSGDARYAGATLE